MHVVPRATLDNISFCKFIKVSIDSFDVQIAILTANIFRKGKSGKSLPKVIENIFNDSFKLVNFANLIALNNVSKNNRIVNITNNGINFIKIKIVKMNGKKTAELNKASKFCASIGNSCIFPPKS